MTIKGNIETNEINQSEYQGCIFIKDFNFVAVLYSNRLDLYDITTLKFKNS